MNAPTEPELFSGKPLSMGGLSNELKLVKLCPPEFRSDNPWSDLAARELRHPAETSNWKWKIKYAFMREQYLDRYHALLGSEGLEFPDRIAIGGWMLSEMLTEVPQYIPEK